MTSGQQRRKWRVGDIQSTQDDFAQFAGVGFVLYDQAGKPCVTFGYLDHANASAAHKHLKDALKDVAYVKGQKSTNLTEGHQRQWS
jgi:hypothetical protein